MDCANANAKRGRAVDVGRSDVKLDGNSMTKSVISKLESRRIPRLKPSNCMGLE